MKLNFHPSRHGYHFRNTFVNHPIPGLAWETKGLCGGMSISAIDYWRAGIAIPTHVPSDFGAAGVPADGSRFKNNILAHQIDSLLAKGVAARWVVSPKYTGADFHNWAVGIEFERAKAAIDHGNPVLLGLWEAP